MPRFGTKLDAATPGLSKLAAAFGGGQQAYQQGFDESALTQSKLAQALSQIRYHDAGAAQTNAETSVLQSRPGAVDEAAAMQSGSTLPMVRAVQDYVRTGVRPMRDLQGPADEAGNGPGQAPVVDDAQQNAISLALQRLLPMRTNLKDTNIEDAAKASGLYREQDLSDKVIAGQLPRNAVAGAQAAVGAKPLFHAGENGAVLDQYGGGLDTSNPMAGASIGLRNQQAAQAKAGAAENYAQAAHANAQAAKSRQEVQDGVKTGQIQVVTDGNGNITLLNKATGVARGAVGPDGQPLHGKAGALNGEQANALGFANRMQASAGILGDLADKGVMQPGRIKQALGNVPVIGGLLEASANSDPTGLTSPSPEQQQVEQAQRDFINAVLRRESGAAIGQNEFANAQQQYFVQPGDKAPVIKQKREAVQRAIQSMLAAVPQGMRGLPEVPGLPPRSGGAVGAPAAAPPAARPPLSSFNR